MIRSTVDSGRTHPSAESRWRRPLVWSALALAVLAVSGMVVLVLNRSAESETRSSFAWATHTLEVENQLHEALAALDAAESAQRGFLLTRDPVYLAPSIQAGDTARRLLGSLRRLTADNAGQQRRLDTLDRLVDDRLSLLRRVVALMQDTLLDRRQGAVERALTHRRFAEEAIAGIALLAVALAAVVWVRLRRAERVMTMCAWSKAIRYEDEWMSIEAYMARRFGIAITHGISPAELERLEADTDHERVLASATQGVAR